MPQGKGTYGSKVGRPPKKGKYEYGGSVDPFSSRNPKGIPAEKEMEAIEEQNAMPELNARDRSQTSPMGNEVGTGVYKEGGFIKGVVEKYRSKAKGKRREKARKKAVEDFPITHVIQPKKKGLKPAKVPSNPPLIKGGTTKEKIKNVARKAVDLGSMGLTIGVTKKKKGKKK